MDLNNIIQTTFQDERKKRFIIIGIFALLIVILAIFFLTRTPSVPQNSNDQLLSDIASLTPRDGFATSTLRLSPKIALSVDHPAIAPGQSANISWTTTYATSCTDGNGDSLDLNGVLSVTPPNPYTFEINCTGPKGTEIQTVTIAVTNEPFINIHASPSAVVPGQPSLISWNTINTDRCVDKMGGTLRLNGSMFVSPKTPYTFEITCTGPKGIAKKSLTITMASPTKFTSGVSSSHTTFTPPLQGTSNMTPVSPNTGAIKVSTSTAKPAGSSNITMTASALTVKYGGTSVISWRTQNATNCMGTTPTGVELINKTSGGDSLFLMQGNPPIPLPNSGSIAIRVLNGQRTATLTLRCDSPNGPTEESITVTTEPAPPGFCESFGHPTIIASASPIRVESGSPSIVTWNSKCATSCKATVSPWGELITYPSPDALKNVDYVEGQDYNKYTSTHGLPNLEVDVRGGIRIYPGAADPSPALPPPRPQALDGDSSSSLNFRSFAALTGASVELKCVNNSSGTVYTSTKTVTVPIIVHPSCSGWFSCIVEDISSFVSSVADTLQATSPTTWVDPSKI